MCGGCTVRGRGHADPTARAAYLRRYRKLDLSELSYGRIANRAPLIDCALI
jgi:hypothetical protein